MHSEPPSMDIDTGAFQGNLLGSSHVFAAPKSNNAQLSGGLMRYHSAPSTVLAGLLDDDYFPASEDSEFAQLLNEGIGSFSSLLDSKGPQQDDKIQAVFTMVAKEEDVYLPLGRANDQRSQYLGTGSTFQEHLSQIPLSVISEYGVEETVDNYCCNQVPLSSEPIQQVSHQLSQIDGASRKSGRASDSLGNSFNSGLIRQSSSPADFLSRLVMEDNSEKVKLGNNSARPHLSNAEEKLVGHRILPSSQVVPAPVTNFTDVKGSSTVTTVSSPGRSNALLRQSSSPAGLLSQINLEEFSMKGALTSTSGIYSAKGVLDRRGPVSGRSHAMGGWDDSTAEQAMQHFAALGQRKRGRAFEDKLLNDMQRSTIDLSTVTMSDFSPPSSSTPGGSIDSAEGSAEDAVLCKARAKRGCATHPRSIAERQRRIKISERMKKLQDLVPNLDKQANTAEMLDEVVEYVKLLQREVKELSLKRPPCKCQQGGSSP
eukprot:c23414_g2_i1 orf=590-2044(-)